MQVKQAATLVIMAAGIGSRYGGLKQAEGVGPQGQLIIDYSLHDAWKAGFKKAVIIVHPQTESTLRERLRPDIFEHMSITFVHQTLDTAVPKDTVMYPQRIKPWGTGHAVVCAAKAIKGPFAVINADDYYGPQAFKVLAEYLSTVSPTQLEAALVGYRLKNTLSEHGAVSRALCEVDQHKQLTALTEHTKILRQENVIYDMAEPEKPIQLDAEAWVSLNCWGFSLSFLDLFKIEFAKFIQKEAMSPTAEFYLPTVVDTAIHEHHAIVHCLGSEDTYVGLTYAEDLAAVRARLEGRTLG